MSGTVSKFGNPRENTISRIARAIHMYYMCYTFVIHSVLNVCKLKKKNLRNRHILMCFVTFTESFSHEYEYEYF